MFRSVARKGHDQLNDRWIGFLKLIFQVPYSHFPPNESKRQKRSVKMAFRMGFIKIVQVGRTPVAIQVKARMFGLQVSQHSLGLSLFQRNRFGFEEMRHSSTTGENLQKKKEGKKSALSKFETLIVPFRFTNQICFTVDG